MKKVLTIIMMAFVAAAMGASAQTTAPAVEKMNAGCPAKLTDDLTLASVTEGEKAVTFVYEISEAMFANLEPMKDILHDTMLAEVMSSPNETMQAIVNFCRTSGKDIVQRFKAGDSSFDIRLTPADLK